MRLRERDKQEITVKAPRPGYGGNAFEAAGEALKAVVRPLNGTVSAQQYGLLPSEMRLLLLESGAAIERGMGVCVDAGEGDDPDYRVEYVAQWPQHAEAHLRYIPPGQRGAQE